MDMHSLSIRECERNDEEAFGRDSGMNIDDRKNEIPTHLWE